MSQYDSRTSANSESAFDNAPRPTHHVHDTSDPLPGARGAQTTTTDYSTGNMEHIEHGDNGARFERRPTGFESLDSDSPASSGLEQQRHSGTGIDRDNEGVPGSDREQEHDIPYDHARSSGTERGDFGTSRTDDRPVGKAGFADKLIGKTEQAVGKLAHKPQLEEKGELRATGGKAAVRGDARAPGI
ncbi:hypothetical protein EW146_g2474 [Bondarzewia mesenterica]|uniref:CsbD-like domain-containing protein n=1 Tax=Bondarzewia mesenterica TaxID=1095465 RepID=A0A4S4M0R3_9AGAM|nr:hypothetical protein EW146_g2474 [Bondarzewia mesenterica]